MILQLALRSLINRRSSVLLTLLSVIVSITILLTVEQIRSQIKHSFTRTISGVDLIVGAPTGELNLLLSTVFHLGNPPQRISWHVFESLQEDQRVSWLIPISLGDSHEGYRVIGTTNAYFNHYQYGETTPLSFSAGGDFQGATSAVLGHEVAQKLKYALSDELIISHGTGNVSFSHHQGFPLRVSGILAATGTPVDQSIFVDHSSIDRMHEAISKPISIKRSSSTKASHSDHAHSMSAPDSPEVISAILVGLKNRISALQLQYKINNGSPPLLAILPGIALNMLWSIMGNLEALLFGISVLIFVAAILGLMTMLLASMRERKQEIAVFRVIGAGPLTILWMIQLEALVIGAVACSVSLGLVSLLPLLFGEWVSSNYGIYLSAQIFNSSSVIVIISVMLTVWLSSFVPAFSAYRQALHSGLSSR